MPCDCVVVCGVENHTEPRVWYLEMYSRWKRTRRGIFNSLHSRDESACLWERENALTSQPLCQGERVHRRPIIRRVLRLLRRLLMQVIHGAQRVHGVERVSVYSVVLHGFRYLQKSKIVSLLWKLVVKKLVTNMLTYLTWGKLTAVVMQILF